MEERRELLAGRGRAWLKRGTSQAGSWRPRKKRRLTSFQWLSALNDALASASRDRINLGKLVVDADPAKRPRALDWMSASCCADRGCDGVSSSFWCRVPARMNLDFVWDMSHIITNSVDEATRCAGLRALAALMDMASNSRHGPWSEGSRWQQVVNVLEYYFDVMTLETCAHAPTIIPKALRDQKRKWERDGLLARWCLSRDLGNYAVWPPLEVSRDTCVWFALPGQRQESAGRRPSLSFVGIRVLTRVRRA